MTSRINSHRPTPIITSLNRVAPCLQAQVVKIMKTFDHYLKTQATLRSIAKENRDPLQAIPILKDAVNHGTEIINYLGAREPNAKEIQFFINNLDGHVQQLADLTSIAEEEKKDS